MQQPVSLNSIAGSGLGATLTYAAVKELRADYDILYEVAVSALIHGVPRPRGNR